jgi:nitrate/nitrite transport system substrate-binding protein
MTPSAAVRIRKTVRLSFVPLTDAAPLIAARELGYFRRHGLDVELSRETSWASVRDKMQTGMVDGSLLLASMPLSLSLGITHGKIDIVTGLVLSLNGNGITVSRTLYKDMDLTGLLGDGSPAGAGQALKAVIDHRRALGKPRLCFASVYLTSTHYYLLRYWMAAAGINADADVRFVVIPPPRMAESLDSGLIDGCCVGEPWNHRAVHEGAGHIVLAGYDVWNNAPEKVLAVRRDWLQSNRSTYVDLSAALIEAAAWIDSPENRREVASMLAQQHYLNVPEDIVACSLTGQMLGETSTPARQIPDFHVFSRYTANFPWLSHAEWFLTQMIRWGHLAQGIDIREAAAGVYLPDVYRQTAAALGITAPTVNYKSEGTHSLTRMLDGVAHGPNLFIDNAPYDCDRPHEYLVRQQEADRLTGRRERIGPVVHAMR